MKKVSYKIAKDLPFNEIEHQFKKAGVGIAIDSHTEEDVNVHFYLLDGTDFSVDEIFALGTLCGTIETIARTKKAFKS